MSDPDADRMVAASRRRAAARAPYLQRLGEVLDAAQSFEVSVGIVFAKCLRCDLPAAQVVTAYQDIKTTLDIINVLASRPEFEPIKLEPKFGGGTVDAANVKKWVRLARRASEARNSVVHSLWFLSEAGVEFGRERRKGKEVPKETIENALKLLEEASSIKWLVWP